MSLFARTLSKTLPECLETIFDCNVTIPNCVNSAHFDFLTLWNITERYAQQCPGGPWLFELKDATSNALSTRPELSNEACEAIAGAGPKWYPSGDVWTRLTTWKFPLYQLVATSPRPPLSVSVEAFTIVHLMGDPVGTIADLLRKIDQCQTRAVFWQDRLRNELILLSNETSPKDRARLWKCFAIIVDSYDEWGVEVGDRAQQYLFLELVQLCTSHDRPEARQEFVRLCLQTADALAADRSTKFLPVIVAQSFFISTVAIAMIRTRSLALTSQPTVFVNIEMYSIAFTAQYFWVIFVVFWTSIIGVSQTAGALPRILGRFRRGLEKEISAGELPSVEIDLPAEFDPAERVFNGGIYAWQPRRQAKMAAHNSLLERRIATDLDFVPSRLQRLMVLPFLRIWPLVACVLPFLVVLAAVTTGHLISGLVPPMGWSCRSTAMLWMLVTWLISYICSFTPWLRNRRVLFWSAFSKDFVSTGVTFGIIIYTQLGVFNRCSCYTGNGTVGLKLPEASDVKQVLQNGLGTIYPGIMAGGIAVQLVLLPGLLLWRYQAAVKVFLSRDDGSSNFEWLYSVKEYAGRRRTKSFGVDPASNQTKSQAVPFSNTFELKRYDSSTKGAVDEIEDVERRLLSRRI